MLDTYEIDYEQIEGLDLEEQLGVLMNKLEVKPYDPSTDTIEIEGTRYSGCLFHEFGCNFPSKIGQVLRVEEKEDGIVTVHHLTNGIDFGDAIEYAAGNLPDGWVIELYVENGSAWVRLERPDGEGEQIDVADMTLTEQVRHAVTVAKECIDT